MILRKWVTKTPCDPHLIPLKGYSEAQAVASAAPAASFKSPIRTEPSFLLAGGSLYVENRVMYDLPVIRSTGYPFDSGSPNRLWFGLFPFDGRVYNLSVSSWFDCDGLLHQAVEEFCLGCAICGG